MSRANIHYAGGIEDKENGTNLTGSQTIFSLDIGKTRNPRVVIDAGAVQGVKKALEFNKNLKKEVLDADFLVITHAHSDHAGMVPYLYKRGFSGRIIMTELTKLQSKEMWLDYVRLTENEIEKVQEMNATFAQRLKNSFSIKNLYETVVQPESYLNILKKEIEEIRNRNKKVKDYYTKYLTIKTAYETIGNINLKLKSIQDKEEIEKLLQDKERNESRLEKTIKNKDPKDSYNGAVKILRDNNIETEADVKALLEEVPKIERNQKNKTEAENKIVTISGNNNYEIAYKEAIATLKEFGVETEGDISAVLKEVPILLFNADDVDMVFAKIETLELKKELELQNFHPISQGNDKSIEKLPEMVKNGYNKPIPVASYLKGTVTSRLQGLIKKIKKQTQENDTIAKNNEELSTQIKFALNFVKWYEEKGESIADFEKQYASLLSENTQILEEKLAELEKITLNGIEYTLDELSKKYQSFDFTLPSHEEYQALEIELKNFGINTKEFSNTIQEYLNKLKVDYIKRVQKASSDILKIKDLKIEDITNIYSSLGFKTPKYNGEEKISNEEYCINIIKLSERIISSGDSEECIKKSFKKFGCTFPRNNNKYIQEQEEKLDFHLQKYIQDIDKHLPNLPDRDYENQDIKSALKNALVVEGNFNSSDYISVINEGSQIEKVIKDLKEGKRVYTTQAVYQELYALADKKVNEYAENSKKNNDITDFLQKAFDLVEIYEGNRELFLVNHQKDYQKAKKVAKNYKRTFIKESIYTKDDLDYALNIEYSHISKDKRIIHITKLNDARLYDILYNNNFNIVYYFDPKIRERVKERLAQEITKIEIEKASQKEKHESYLSAVQFMRVYEGHEKINISQEEYLQAKSVLDKHSIKSKADIASFNFFDTSFRYSGKEIIELFENIQIVDKNFSINDIEIIHITDINDERMYDLPYSYNDYEKLFVIQGNIKEDIKKKLLEGMGDFYRTSAVRRKKRKEILEKLKLLQKYKQNADFLINIEGYESANDLKNEVLSRNTQVRSLREKLSSIKNARILQARLNEGGEQKEKDYIEAKKLLETYKIETIDDIGKILQVQSYIPYSVRDIERTIELLKSIHIDKNQDILESIKLNFFDAGHIEGSVQAVLTLVVSEVDNILNGKTEIYTGGKRRLKHVNYGFSGDLGRIKDPNLAGSPKVIPFKLDYYQTESTYAERIHIAKQIAINKFFEAIETAQGKILIPAFSMQRTQELLMIVLERRLESQKFIDQIKELTQEKKLKEAELALISPTASDREILEEKELLEEEIFQLESRINYIKPLIFDYDIVLDSPLSEKITEIYIENCGDKYNLLDKNVQVKLFGKEIITYVKKTSEGAVLEEQENRITLEELYSPERRDKKEIVFSASGMCDGGAILPHLKEILQNNPSKIIAVGYAPPSTRLGRIKAHDEFISIDAVNYELLCEIDDITGFSGHADEEEIITFLSDMQFTKNAVISLTHGGEERHKLAKKIETVMEFLGKKVQVIVPKLGNTTTLRI